MKKILAFLLTAVLLLSLCCGLAAAEPLPPAGSYTLVGMTDEDGGVLDEQLKLLAALGQRVTLEIAEDGSGVLDFFGDTSTLRIDAAAGTAQIDDSNAAYRYADGMLTFEEPEGNMSLRFACDAQPETAGEPVSAPQPAAPAVDGGGIPGEYALRGMVDENGEDLSEQLALLQSLGMSATLSIQADGSAELDLFGDVTPMQFDFAAMTVTADGSTVPFSWDEGLLVIAEDGASLTLVRSGSDEGEEAPAPVPAAEERRYFTEELVVVDDERCCFKLTGVKETEYELSLNAYIENRSDKNLSFTWDDAVVNGYALDLFWSQDVRAGKKANVSIPFNKAELDALGLEWLDEIRFTLRADDYDDFWADSFLLQPCAVYPTGLDPQSVVYPERLHFPGEKTLLDSEDAGFTVLLADPEGDFGYTLLVCVENRSDSELYFSWDEVSVNDYMLDPYWGCTVPAHAAAYEQIVFYPEDLADNGIETVDRLEFKLSVSDYDTWDTLFAEYRSYEP